MVGKPMGLPAKSTTPIWFYGACSAYSVDSRVWMDRNVSLIFNSAICRRNRTNRDRSESKNCWKIQIWCPFYSISLMTFNNEFYAHLNFCFSSRLLPDTVPTYECSGWVTMWQTMPRQRWGTNWFYCYWHCFQVFASLLIFFLRNLYCRMQLKKFNESNNLNLNAFRFEWYHMMTAQLDDGTFPAFIVFHLANLLFYRQRKACTKDAMQSARKWALSRPKRSDYVVTIVLYSDVVTEAALISSLSEIGLNASVLFRERRSTAGCWAALRLGIGWKIHHEPVHLPP